MSPDRTPSRRRAWITLVLGLVTVLAVIGGLKTTDTASRSEPAPANSESARAARVLATLPGHDVQPVLLVATRQDGRPITSTDVHALNELGRQLPTAAGHPASSATRSADRLAATVQVPILTAASNTDNATTIAALRQRIADARPEGLQVLVTGGPAFGADIASAFDGANVTLLLVTVGIVALLLLLTYRSPVLWLIPLAVVALADQAAATVTARLGAALDLQFDAGIVSVLVFGAGTNYALLLISRYREQLHTDPDHLTALAAARRRITPAVLASNVTVVLALASLVFASTPGIRGLGVAAAAGLLITLVCVLVLLPAALAVTGRRVFWPFVPEAGSSRDVRSGIFGRVATRVVRRPAVIAGAAVALLAVLGTGLLGTGLGLSQTERFRGSAESATGLQVLAQHYPAGAAQPILVVTDSQHAEAASRAAATVRGVHVLGAPRPARDAGISAAVAGPVVVTVISDASPGTPEARQSVEAVRAAVHRVPGAPVLVGGPEAADVDARAGNEADLQLIVPLVFVLTGLVLVVLLRSVVAPLLLLPVNGLSALGAIGAGSWMGRHVLGWPALDLQVPLIAFLFLVALGVDYTIFLAHRARDEAVQHGTREGMVRAVGATGTVITSAGVVLAAVFAALGVLPLVTLGQLGLIVGLGVLLDTLVVRTLLVPALAGLVRDRLWWPAGPGRAARRTCSSRLVAGEELASAEAVPVNRPVP